MNFGPRVVTTLGLSLVCVVSATGCQEGEHPLSETPLPEQEMAEAPFNAPVKDPLTVMSRNLYHGGDIGPVLQVGFSDLELLAETAAGVWAEVQANDFSERAVAIVDEIQAADADIVGLQELALFVSLGLNPSTGSFDVTGAIDFRGILEAELANRGLPYSFAAVQDNTQVTVPVAGFDAGGRFIPSHLVQMTIRDAVLVRGDLNVESVEQGNYDTVVPLGTDPFGDPIQLSRGWIRVTADVDGVPHHFVNTHLEIQSFSPFQLLQTEELLTNITADLDGVIILMGDFNSDAAALPGAPTWTLTYAEVQAAGFRDIWTEAHPGAAFPGLTCCNASDLRNQEPSFYQRIDFIFVRTPEMKGPHGHLPGVVRARVIGDDPEARTAPNGLWPSDHAGVVADLFWPPGQLGKHK